MKTFLIDRDKIYSYDKLLVDINNAKLYCKAFKTHDLYEYFINLILALISNKNLILLDVDLNELEIKSTLINFEVNKKASIDFPKLDSFDKLIECILKSTSKISIFTSGTTGQPKEVVHSVLTLTRAVRRSEKYANQVWGYAYNPTHMAGLQVFFQAFENKNSLVNIFNSSRSNIFQSIEKYKITNISATPTFYRLLLPFEMSYPSVKRITLGGEKSDAKLHEIILKFFPNAKLNNIYASTEAGSLLVAKNENFQIPGNFKDIFKIVDFELLIHKSMLGTSDNFIFEDNYYKTGDLVEWIDESEGLFRFKSRKNELINVGGYKVNPSEVEDIILGLTKIQQVVVYGKPNSVLGNILCADIKLNEECSMLESDIRIYLSDKLQDFKIPRKIKFIESFSLTRTGKTKRI